MGEFKTVICEDLDILSPLGVIQRLKYLDHTSKGPVHTKFKSVVLNFKENLSGAT